jgi:haloalkane dehalogenase
MAGTDWIDRNEYPFKSNYLQLPMGKMHYVDEGQGPAIVMVHGNPAWSFVYRHLIKGLSGKYRCVAPDLIGFGLSDKPYDWSYLPKDHAANFNTLVETLGLKDITLVVQDWGGPIGLSYAVNKPENVKNLVIMNTWMWSVKGDPHYEKFSNFAGGPLGRFLIRYFNFFAKNVMKMATADYSKLKPVHAQYTKALPTTRDRKGSWVFPRQIIWSSEWLDSLWQQSPKIKDKPALMLWGMKDIAFREIELNKWIGLFSNKTVYKFENVGHFVQEEKGAELVPLVEEFMAKNK